MKKLIITLIIIFTHLLNFSQINTFGKKEEKVQEFFFAIRLMPNQTGNLVQVAIIKENFSDKDDVTFLTLKSWARQFAGFETSKANPDRINMIKNNEIFDIPPNVAGIGESEIEYYTINKTSELLNNLWRLRYSEYPYFNPGKNTDKGWAKHPDPKITWLPSENQLQILRIYGIENLNDFIIGDNAIQLLKDVRNNDWQRRYIQSGDYFEDEP